MSEERKTPEEEFEKAFDEGEDFADPLEDLVERTRVDPIAPFAVIAELAELRQLNPRSYAEIRFGIDLDQGLEANHSPRESDR